MRWLRALRERLRLRWLAHALQRQADNAHGAAAFAMMAGDEEAALHLLKQTQQFLSRKQQVLSGLAGDGALSLTTEGGELTITSDGGEVSL